MKIGWLKFKWILNLIFPHTFLFKPVCWIRTCMKFQSSTLASWIFNFPWHYYSFLTIYLVFSKSRLSIYGGDKNFKVWHYKKLLIFKLYTTFNLSYKVGRRFKQNFEGAIVQNNVNFPHAFFIRYSIISTPESWNLPTPFWKPNAQLVCSRKKTMGYVSHYILME